MATVTPYIDTLTTARIAKEIIARSADGTIVSDVPLLFNQIHAVLGYGFSYWPGTPGEPHAPIIPIGDGALSEADAIARIHIVEQIGHLPAQGSTSWFTVALRIALKAAIERSKLPDEVKITLLALIERVL